MRRGVAVLGERERQGHHIGRQKPLLGRDRGRTTGKKGSWAKRARKLRTTIAGGAKGGQLRRVGHLYPQFEAARPVLDAKSTKPSSVFAGRAQTMGFALEETCLNLLDPTHNAARLCSARGKTWPQAGVSSDVSELGKKDDHRLRCSQRLRTGMGSRAEDADHMGRVSTSGRLLTTGQVPGTDRFAFPSRALRGGRRTMDVLRLESDGKTTPICSRIRRNDQFAGGGPDGLLPTDPSIPSTGSQA